MERPVVRRIVTGEAEDGRAVFAINHEVEPLAGHWTYWGVWGWDELPQLPFLPIEDYEPKSLYAHPGGVRVTMLYFPPSGSVEQQPEEELNSNLASLEVLRRTVDSFQSFDQLGEGFHRTDDIDVIFPISGEVGLEQDGEEVLLRPGDCLIQHGAVHAWRPKPSGCLLGLVVVGSSRHA